MALRFVSFGAALLLVACQPTFGEGVGRRPLGDVPLIHREPVVLREVFLASGLSADHYVELANVGTTPLNLAGWSLLGFAAGQAELGSVEVSGTIDAEATLEVPVGALSLNPSADEVALADAEGRVQAYLAWGASAAAFASPLSGMAELNGVSARSFVPVPYPMPSGGAVIALEESSGCGTPSPDSAAQASDVGGCVAPAIDLVIAEVAFDVLAEGSVSVPGFVELHNRGSQGLSLLGLRYCFDTRCAVVRERDPLTVNGRVVLRPALPPITADSNATHIPTQASLGLLRPGDLASVAGEDLISFVFYAEASDATPGPLTAAARIRGLWPVGGPPVLVPLDGAGATTPESIQLLTGAEPGAVGREAFDVAEQTPGAALP